MGVSGLVKSAHTTKVRGNVESRRIRIIKAEVAQRFVLRCGMVRVVPWNVLQGIVPGVVAHHECSDVMTCTGMRAGTGVPITYVLSSGK